MRSGPTRLRRPVQLLAALLISLLLPLSPARATVVALNFASLPSAQGWTFFPGVSPAGFGETDVFSVTGGVLTMDTRTTLSGSHAL